jgi:hypothetical protein
MPAPICGGRQSVTYKDLAIEGRLLFGPVQNVHRYYWLT